MFSTRQSYWEKDSPLLGTLNLWSMLAPYHF
jgi:hypothetical protein